MQKKKIKIKVIPKAKQVSIEESLDGDLKIRLISPPTGGKANQELIKILAKYYQIPKSKIQIVLGQTSRHKIVEIE